MKRFLFCFMIAFSMQFSSNAQTTYSVSSIAYNPDPFTAGIMNGPMGDDVYSATMPIGFTFEFYGRPYDSLRVGSNGVITFNTYGTSIFCPWTIQGPPPSSFSFVGINNSILSPWQDINPSIGGVIKTAMNGLHRSEDSSFPIIRCPCFLVPI